MPRSEQEKAMRARARTVQPGRFTAELDGDFVVFVIGMRINSWWKFHQWVPVARSMRPMIRELVRHPGKGLLGLWGGFAGRTAIVVQYWRSFEDLEAFARNPDDPHLPAWRRFNRVVGASGDVGVYHETFRVSAGSYEALYANMPVMGLAAAGRSVPIGRGLESARQRLDHGVPGPSGVGGGSSAGATTGAGDPAMPV